MSEVNDDPSRLVTPHVCDHGIFRIRATPFVNKDELTLRARRWGHLHAELKESFGDDWALNDLYSTGWRPIHICACHIEFLSSRHTPNAVLPFGIINRCSKHADYDTPVELFEVLRAEVADTVAPPLSPDAVE